MVFGTGEHQVLSMAQVLNSQTHDGPQVAGQLPCRRKSEKTEFSYLAELKLQVSISVL